MNKVHISVNSMIGGYSKKIRDIPSFPHILSKYYFIKEIDQDKKNIKYQFAIYKDIFEKKYFVKKWTGKIKNKAYHFLKNEIEVYKYLNSQQSPSIIDVPKLLDVIEGKNCLYVLLEYIAGKNLMDLTPGKKLVLFENAMDYLDLVGIPDSKYKIDRRPPIYWIAILPYITVKAIILHPALLVQILKGFYFAVSNSISLISRKQRSLIHRDFNDYNVIMGKKNNYLIDFQLTCIADPTIEYAVIFLKYNHDVQMIKNIINKIKRELDLKAKKNMFIYLTILSIYDLSLPEGSYDLSLQCLTKSINQSL